MRQAINNRSKASDCGQKGVVAVELALVLPLFALLLLGTFEMGLIGQEHQILQNAAREGARFSAMPANRMDLAPEPSDVLLTIQNRVVEYLANENITVLPADVTVDQEYPISIGGLTVNGTNITINYQRALHLPGVASFIPLGTVELTGNAVFRNFY